MNRPPHVVLDTNVVISAMLWRGKPGQLFSLAGEGDIRLYSSAKLVAELAATLAKPKLLRAVEATGLTPTTLVANYRQLVRLVRPKPIMTQISRDADDDHVLACALAARAGYLVSGDDDLLVLGHHQDVTILTVDAVLNVLANR